MRRPSEPRRRLDELDALRGLAAFAVVVAHALNYLPGNVVGSAGTLTDVRFWRMLVNGHVAVLLFFGISGFVLSWPYFRGTKRGPDLTLDVLNRTPRLLIPIVASGLLCYGLQSFVDGTLPPFDSAAYDAARWISLWNVQGHDLHQALSFMIFDVLLQYREVDSFNVNLWTMPIEWSFSFAVFAAAACACGRYWTSGLLCVLWMTTFLSSPAMQEPSLYTVSLGLPFALGVLMARVHAYHSERLAFLVRIHPGLIVAGAWSAAVLGASYEAGRLGTPIVNHLAAFSFLTLGVRRMVADEYRGSRLTRYLARISFPLYLLHGSILYATFRFAQAASVPTGIASFVFLALGAVAVSCALSAWFVRRIDEPATRASKRTVRRLLADVMVRVPGHGRRKRSRAVDHESLAADDRTMLSGSTKARSTFRSDPSD